MLSQLRRIPLFVALGHVALAASAAFGATAETDSQIVEQAQWLKGRGQLEQAQELLTRWAALHAESELLVLARADLYLAASNPFWALKVLSEYRSSHPSACQARMFEARVQLSQANLEEAESLLREPGCSGSEPVRVRRLLLEAELAELRGSAAEAKRLVDEAARLPERYIEDDVRLAVLERAYEPERRPLWTFALDAGLGYASTGMGVIPPEVVTPRSQSGSAVASLDLLAHAQWPVRPWVRPLAEIGLLVIEQLGEVPRELSLQQPSLLVGLELGRHPTRFELAYGYDFISFDATDVDQDGFFSSAHRGEYRLDFGSSLIGFGRVGYRTFRDDRLSRLESEQGLRQGIHLSETLELDLGTAWRVRRAKHTAFDQLGATAQVSLSILAPKGYLLVESLGLSEDRFPNSEGFYAPHSADRRDFGLDAKATLFTPERFGTRLGLSYEYVDRDSNVALYDRRDHRAFLSLSYRTNHDEWRAKRIGPEGRVPMRHEKETPAVVTSEERSVREVLRRDEELRRNSSCLK